MSASTSPQPHFVLALESVICWTLHGWLCKPGGALLLHKVETKDDRTQTGSSVVVENMRARLSLVTLTPLFPVLHVRKGTLEGSSWTSGAGTGALWLHKPKLNKVSKRPSSKLRLLVS